LLVNHFINSARLRAHEAIKREVEVLRVLVEMTAKIGVKGKGNCPCEEEDLGK
jgi:hypothetical protein